MFTSVSRPLPSCGVSRHARTDHRSIGSAAACNFETGSHHDAQIKPQAPVVDIPEIGLDPLHHGLDPDRLATKAVDLRPARNTGLDVMAECIVGDEPSILIVVSKRV